MLRSIGLVTLNAKYIHSSLSLRYLRNAARDAGHKNVWIKEFVINQPVWKIASEIQKFKPDILGVGIYIWNRSQSFELIERLKKQNPNLKIVIGGPEVSFEKETSIDCPVISGEGEKKWVEYLQIINKGEVPSNETLDRWKNYGSDLPELKPAYLDEDYTQLKNRLVYFETSRGCPYLCSFCLSALDKTVRYFPEEIVYGQIKNLINSGIKKIKFVDRTFNLKPNRMKSLMGWLSQFEGSEFHFEVVGDILTPDLLDSLKTVPPGMFQFEIGIQTTDESVQKNIQRKQDNKQLFKTIKKIIAEDRIHFHCDLIFGLPGENKEKILNSFKEVLALRPHELQLGFLKFLPGAPIKNNIQSHGYEYQSTPPYELISNKDLSADEIDYLKKFTDIFNRFYNSKRFQFSINHLLQKLDAVALFDQLLAYHESNNLFMNPVALDDQYKIFKDTFFPNPTYSEKDLLKLDYLYSQKTYRLPAFLSEKSNFSRKTWKEDRKTPIIPFKHKIEISGSQAHLKLMKHPVYYAVCHSTNSSGYFHKPVLNRIDESGI